MSITLTGLTVEHLREPLGLATGEPRFSWVIDPGDADGVRQQAYKLEVRRESAAEALWTTGRVDSEQSVLVEYAGPPVDSATAYRWQVRAWCADEPTDEPTDWAASSFETSLLDPADWIAGWVEPEQEPVGAEGARNFGEVFEYQPAKASVAERLHPSPHLRQVFELTEEPVRGRLYITAHGIYQAELNGSPVGDQVLAPGYQSYDEALAFQTYDITDALRVGRNALAVIVADGWYAGRISLSGASRQYGDRLQASWQLVITDATGARRVITSDGAVRSTTGPVRYADIFIGECHDARAELAGGVRT